MSRLQQVARHLMVSALLLGLAAPALAQSGRLGGQVVDDESGEPIAGAQIRIQSPDADTREAVTDGDGRYSQIGFSSGMWQVYVRAEGYNDDLGNVNVTQSSSPPVDFRLTRVRHALVQALGEEAMEGLDPDAIEADLSAADAAFNSENWEAAIAGYSSLLEQLPQLTNLYSQIGQAYRARGDYPEALSAFEMRLAADPDDENVKADIARTRLAMGDFAAAQEELAAAASGLDASREDLYNLGELEFAQGAVDAAAGWYEKAAMVDPNWAKPIFKLALVALNKGDMEGAKEHFRRVVELDPSSEEGSQASATLAALP
jgi:tetratricopeptide (TPR) repeat protein